MQRSVIANANPKAAEARVLTKVYATIRLALVVVAAACASACAAPLARNGVPDAKLAETATIPDLPGIRAWGDLVTDDPIGEVVRQTPHMPRIGQTAKTADGRPLSEILALSGGGADGAFGAGVLVGWSERGDRPNFQIVTGVSAGAIIAPFAYLGPAYDESLRRIWTDYQASDVVQANILPGLFGGAALADTSPMAKLIAQYIDADLLRAVAHEYDKGRILAVLTTNLDAQRPVVWNMGEIARDGTPQALQLFRDVIRASAAIPGAFPPVKIEVQANGQIYDELHVDGGTTREVFALPVQAPFRAFDALYPSPPVRRLYIIKNGKVTPEYEIVEGTTLKIASRSISTLIKNQNLGELYRLYRLAKDDDVDFNLIAVPRQFEFKTTEIYDQKYQRALFAEGVAAGKVGRWMKTPPGQPNGAAPSKSMTKRQSKKLKATTSKPSANSAPTSGAPKTPAKAAASIVLPIAKVGSQADVDGSSAPSHSATPQQPSLPNYAPIISPQADKSAAAAPRG